MTINAQETKSQPETKMDIFLSKTGVVRKFIDYNLTPLKSTYESTETRVRRFIIDSESKFFFQISKSSKYGKRVASIEYTDLLEVMKALSILKESVNSDVSSNPDYLENKFITVDGFQVGYYVSKGKAKWYAVLEKYGSDNTIYFDDVNMFENICIEAKTKIEDLRK